MKDLLLSLIRGNYESSEKKAVSSLIRIAALTTLFVVVPCSAQKSEAYSTCVKTTMEGFHGLFASIG